MSTTIILQSIGLIIQFTSLLLISIFLIKYYWNKRKISRLEKKIKILEGNR